MMEYSWLRCKSFHFVTPGLQFWDASYLMWHELSVGTLLMSMVKKVSSHEPYLNADLMYSSQGVQFSQD